LSSLRRNMTSGTLRSYRIRVGDEFPTFEEAERAVYNLARAEGSAFWRRDSRTVRAASKRVKTPINPLLRFYQVTWACLKGGRKDRANLHSRIFSNCTAKIRVSASRDGQKLVVVKADLEHNHLPDIPDAHKSRTTAHCDQVTFVVEGSEQQSLFGQEQHGVLKRKRQATRRREQPPSRAEQTEKGPILPEQSVKQVGLSDSPNLNGVGLSPSPTWDYNLDGMLTEIKNDTDNIVEVLVDEGRELSGIYYQDKLMQKHFELFPELLLVDATFTLASLSMTVYVQFAVDGNGESEIVSVFVVNEDAETVSAMLDIFKHYNPAWERTQSILTDRGSTDREVYKCCLPRACIQSCPLHTFLSMEREINPETMKVKLKQRQHCLEHMRKMLYSSSVEEYEENVESFYQTGVKPAISYFNRMWNPVREDWVVGLNESCLFKQGCTEWLAAVHYKLSRIACNFSDLKSFFLELKQLSQTLRLGREKQLVKAMLNTLSLSSSSEPVTAEAKYSKMLTPYAHQLVLKQLLQISNEGVPDVETEGGAAAVLSGCGPIRVTATTCTCPFAALNRLPCRHVFAFRANHGLDLFSEDGVAARWCLKHYCRKLLQEDMEALDPSSTDPKHGFTESLLQRLVRLTAAPSTEVYEERIEILGKLASLWKQGKHASVIELVEVRL
ncbi:hypothetical protein P4O66_019243, partial [Electrophorus voltai]